MTDLSELRGELLALRCHVSALVEVLPLSAQLRFSGKLSTSTLLLRPSQSGYEQSAFDRAAKMLSAKRPTQQQAG